MIYKLPNIPKRTTKPRDKGLTMMMDKGLSIRQAEDFIESSGHLTDMVKLGFGTSMISNRLEDKIKIYQTAGLDVYFGGTLFEAFVVRDMFEEYLEFIAKYNVTMVEVSDGSIEISHEKKCEFISILNKRNITVLSEVGSKDSNKLIPPYKWIELMNKEIEA